MGDVIPKGFRGLRWEPTDEQEVVLLFGRLLEYLPRPLSIEFVRTGFPDCKATDSENGDEISIEFKLKSSFFRRDYAHRAGKCQWVVCWEDDAATSSGLPTIVSLKKIVSDHAPGLILNTLLPSRTPAETFQARTAVLSSGRKKVIHTLLDFGNTQLRVQWPRTNATCFTVRGVVDNRRDIECFKVYANGLIGIPFNRWKGVTPTALSAVVNSLNSALRTSWFTGQGKTSRDIAELIPDEAAARRFMDVWRKFAAAPAK